MNLELSFYMKAKKSIKTFISGHKTAVQRYDTQVFNFPCSFSIILSLVNPAITLSYVNYCLESNMSEEKNAEQNVQIKMFSIVSLPMILIKIVGSDSLPNNFWRTSSDNLSSTIIFF